MRWPGVVDGEAAASLRKGVEALDRAGFAPAWIWVFDLAWDVIGRLTQPLSWFLGDDPITPPHFWAWRIAGANDAGWPPHRDWSQPAVRDGVAIGLTVWIPLTPVGLDDGCIGLVRADRDRGDGDIDPRDVRQLPAKIGDALVWRADALHWGGRPSVFAAGPRLSMAFEAQNASFPAMAEPAPSLSRAPPPTARIAAVAARLSRYGAIDADRRGDRP